MIQSENLDGAHGRREHIVWEWIGNKWKAADHPDNDWTPDKRKAQRLMAALLKDSKSPTN